ncbi:MAG: histidinol-phosphate transaminase [Woeseia sp.]
MSAELARPEIAALKPYVTALQQPDTLRLNANEAPVAPLADGLNRYPQIRPDALQAALAALFAVHAEQLLVTRGSSEAIDLLTRTFCRAYQDNVVVMPPTFSMYQVYARMQGAEVIEVPLDPDADFAPNIDEILARCTEYSKLVFVCSPNNPTGGSVPFSDIERLLRVRAGKSLIVVDEAYIEFSDEPSLIEQLERFPNLVILRTLSKAWGLAGSRCGAVLANPPIIELLGRLLPPYAFSAPSTERVLQSLSDRGQANARNVIAATIAERDKVGKALRAMPCVSRVWPSDANFLLVRFASLAPLRDALQKKRILIREFGDSSLLWNCARITIGNPEQNSLLLQALAEVSEATA